MSVVLLEAAWPRLRSKFAEAAWPAEPPKRPSRRPWLGRFSYPSYSVIVVAFKRSLALRDIRQCLLLAIRASRQAVKKGAWRVRYSARARNRAVIREALFFG
jgi:hypothetical protein